nr:hypothetical protein [Tanacetum cinerariifolium]
FAASATQLGTFTVSNASAPLPVALVSFTAERLGTDGLLKWTTASELRNDHFEVESSLDGSTFRLLGRVASAGTSSQAHSYQFIDKNLARYAAPLVYYRLRQAGPATLRLTDVLGRELSQQLADLPAGATTLPLPGTGQLATGVYLLRVQQGISGITQRAVTSDYNVYNGKQYAVQTPAPVSMPTDPGHEFSDVLEQLAGAGASYPAGGAYPAITNAGFVSNYATSTDEQTGTPSTAAVGDVMQC